MCGHGRSIEPDVPRQGCFARIRIFCPSIKLDPQYKPLRDYLEKMTDQKKEPLMFEEMDHAHLGKILDEQREIVDACRKRKVKPPQVLLILDDLGDQGDVLASRRGGKSGGSWLTTLACRSRCVSPGYVPFRSSTKQG